MLGFYSCVSQKNPVEYSRRKSLNEAWQCFNKKIFQNIFEVFCFVRLKSYRRVNPRQVKGVCALVSLLVPICLSV